MRRDESAATAGPTKSRGGSVGDFLRGALATRACSSRAGGSGAPAIARPASLWVAAAAALLVLVLVAGDARAAQVRLFTGPFGSAAQPTFGNPEGLAVDATGDLLVIDAGAGTVSRWNPDGTPAAFSALGTNVIDGVGSGDETQHGGLTFGGAAEVQVAVDTSSGVTAGSIYVTQVGQDLIDIFSSTGSYLGQLTGAGSESFAEPCGVTVDPTGAVYVGDFQNAGVYKFVPAGNPPTNADSVAKFTAVDRPCAVAAGAGSAAGALFVARYSGPVSKLDATTGTLDYVVTGGPATTVASDPTSGHVLVAEGSKVTEYDASGAESAVKVAPLDAASAVQGVAAAASGEVYVARAGPPNQIDVFGVPVSRPTVAATAPTGVTGTKATLNGSVDPEGLPLEECFFEWGETTAYGNTVACDGTIGEDSEPHPVSAAITGLTPNGATYHFRLVATNENGAERSADKTFVTANTVGTEPATGIGAAGATLNGVLRPEGEQFTSCAFEYGLSTSAGFEEEAECIPPVTSIEADFSIHAVSAALSGLKSNATYKFRLTASNSKGTLSGKVLTFTTQGPPRITELRASYADQTSATLEAKINPSGFATNYRFEWGPTTAYGRSVPAEFEPFVGAGEVPVKVSAKITGLSAATIYHFRVVATNSVDVTQGPDQTLETLNSCGLFEGRCFELVSPRDVGPVASPGKPAADAELHFQAASQPGSLAYVVETGFPEATRGAEVLYKGTRDASGWSSIQLSPPIVSRDEGSEANSNSSKTLGLSEDLSCNIFESSQPLTDDASTRLVIEAGGANLYRHNPDNSYTAITKLAPENPSAGKGRFVGGEYPLAGFSQDCGKVLFTAPYHYPGVPGGEIDDLNERLYEWDEGTLRGVGFVPGPSGQVEVGANPGSGERILDGNHTNVVSDDGSRVFFSAERQTSPNPAEIGTTGIFVREDGGASIRDLSLSETAIPNEGATFQWATKDGSKVFFTANAGLTAESSDAGTDLYEFDLESEELTDLSANGEEGAGVGGFIGASEDGSHVYFVAKGQLVPGKGRTFAQNQSEGTYSVFGVKQGEVGYVGVIPNKPTGIYREQLFRVIATSKRDQTARVSPDGRYLLFESSLNLTGYDSGERVPEAYLYDAEASTEATICVSCRQDGKASVSPNLHTPLEKGDVNLLHAPRTLIAPGGEPRVFFTSFNRLASGAVEGETNLYEWSHGQVFHVATEPSGLRGPILEDNDDKEVTLRSTEVYVNFIGVSADGVDLYFATPETLTWEDGDDRFSIYSARIGGGSPEPPPPPGPCDPAREGSCQAPPASGTSTPRPASSTFTGPGNAKPKARRGKRHHKRHHKKGKGKRKQAKRGHAARHANGNGRAGK